MSSTLGPLGKNKEPKNPRFTNAEILAGAAATTDAGADGTGGRGGGGGRDEAQDDEEYDSEDQYEAEHHREDETKQTEYKNYEFERPADCT